MGEDVKEVEGKVKPPKKPWRRTEYALGEGAMADLVYDKVAWEAMLEDYLTNREQIIAKVRHDMIHMLDEAVGVIRDCMHSGTKEDGIRLKAAIWVLEAEGIVKTEKFEFINYDGNFGDKADLLKQLKDELNGTTGELKPLAIEAVAERTKTETL